MKNKIRNSTQPITPHPPKKKENERETSQTERIGFSFHWQQEPLLKTDRAGLHFFLNFFFILRGSNTPLFSKSLTVMALWLQELDI